LKIEDPGENEEEQELAIKLRLAEASLDHLQTNYADEISTIDAYDRLKEKYVRMIEISNKKLLKEESDTSGPGFLPRYRQMLIELVNVRRKELQKLHKEKMYSSELIRNKERELDLEEARLSE
jgi:CPA1 family monovalent cation:H+ antiporter